MLSSIIGHEAQKPGLLNLVGRAGCFLFSGPPSIGKRTVALEISRRNLCLGSKEDGCTCRSCKIFGGDHPDLLCLGSQKLLVEDVDRLMIFNSRAPLISGTKISIIDNAERMTPESANRLLKTLEESPYTFFLISSDPGGLLPTIRSRCQAAIFSPLSQEDVTNILFQKFGFEPTKARVLGWIGVGSSADIFSKAGLYLKYRDMACDFLQNIRDLLSSLDFIDKIAPAELGIFVDMVITVMTDVLLLKNKVEGIVNCDKRDTLVKLSAGFKDKALVSALGYMTQVRKQDYLNISLVSSLKNCLIKAHPILSL